MWFGRVERKEKEERERELDGIILYNYM